MSDTNIPVSDEARSELRQFKAKYGESYSDAIFRLLDRPPRTFQIRFQELDNDRPMSYEFVEVENRDGESISIGEWEDDGDWRLLVVADDE